MRMARSRNSAVFTDFRLQIGMSLIKHFVQPFLDSCIGPAIVVAHDAIKNPAVVVAHVTILCRDHEQRTAA